MSNTPFNISRDESWNLCFNLLLDPSISEIQANGPNEFFIKKNGKRIHLNTINLPSDEAYLKSIEDGLTPHMKSVHPYNKDGFLFEGPLEFKANGQKIRGRSHIVLSPTSDNPQVTIAKKSTSLAQIEDIAARGSMSTEMLQFLKAAINADLTMVISGGTGAGKTTMLEALTKMIGPEVRIGVAEDTPELSLIQKNVSYLHSVPWRPGMDEKDAATLSWVVAQFQRMRTDRLIIGETRGKEFADFLIAANSGMDGSMTTIHANDPVRALAKMTNFALKGSERQPIRAINTDIANSIDLIVQLGILPDGSHKVFAIQEITNTLGTTEEATITTNPLYEYKKNLNKWVKTSKITDQLREKFANKKIDFSLFLNAQTNSLQEAHGGGAVDSTRGIHDAKRTSGLPERRRL